MGERKQLLRIGLEDLDVAQSMGLIDGTKREDLEAFLIKASEARGGGSRLVSFAYYLGAMMVISALTWFVADAWDFMSGLGLAAWLSGTGPKSCSAAAACAFATWPPRQNTATIFPCSAAARRIVRTGQLRTLGRAAKPMAVKALKNQDKVVSPTGFEPVTH